MARRAGRSAWPAARRRPRPPTAHTCRSLSRCDATNGWSRGAPSSLCLFSAPLPWPFARAAATCHAVPRPVLRGCCRRLRANHMRVGRERVVAVRCGWLRRALRRSWRRRRAAARWRLFPSSPPCASTGGSTAARSTPQVSARGLLLPPPQRHPAALCWRGGEGRGGLGSCRCVRGQAQQWGGRLLWRGGAQNRPCVGWRRAAGKSVWVVCCCLLLAPPQA